jgi:hypothetical protein
VEFKTTDGLHKVLIRTFSISKMVMISSLPTNLLLGLELLNENVLLALTHASKTVAPPLSFTVIKPGRRNALYCKVRLERPPRQLPHVDSGGHAQPCPKD